MNVFVSARFVEIVDHDGTVFRFVPISTITRVDTASDSA